MRYKDEAIVNEGELIFYDKISKVEVFKDEGVIFYYEKIKESIEALKETERDSLNQQLFLNILEISLILKIKLSLCMVVE